MCCFSLESSIFNRSVIPYYSVFIVKTALYYTSKMCKLLSISLLILEISLFSASQSYQLVFEDDFNESSLNTNDWTISQDPVGNTNNELQSYDPANIQVANGILSITAKIDSYYQGKPIYSSGKIDTKSAHTFKYGRFEVRMKVPRGKGMWPAFWMLPSTSMYGPWAKSGEIDIAEVRGSQSQTVLGTIHYGNVSNSETYTTASYSIAGGHSLADDFHVYAVEWDQEPPSIRWFLDGINYANQTAWFSVGNPYPAPFDQVKLWSPIRSIVRNTFIKTFKKKPFYSHFI